MSYRYASRALPRPVKGVRSGLFVDSTTVLAAVVLVFVCAAGANGILAVYAPITDPAWANYNNTTVGLLLFSLVVVFGSLGSLRVLAAERYHHLRVKWFGALAAAASAVAIVGLSGYSSIVDTGPVPTLSASDYRADRKSVV